MQYKRLGNDRDYRLNVSTLDGGVNASTHETLIEDNELTEACNVEWRGGALCTRGAITAAEDAPLCALDTVEADAKQWHSICARPFTAFGELCTVVMLGTEGGTAGTYYKVALVTMDGAVKYVYTLGTTEASKLTQTGDNVPIVAVPCEEAQYGAPFLVYRAFSVYRPKETAPQQGILELMSMDELYAPLVMINGTGTIQPIQNPNGVMLEGYNLLSSYYRAQYTSSVSGAANQDIYKLPAPAVLGSDITMEIVTENGVTTVAIPFTNENQTVTVDGTEYTVIVGATSLTFHPPLPQSTVSGNVTFTVERDATNTTLLQGFASLATWFGGTNDRFGGTRLFMSGFGDARIVWSDVGNPLYFPENNYMVVGDPTQKITVLEKQEDMLVIFKERELYYTTYVQGEIDADSVAQGTNVDVTAVAAYFPLTQLSPYIGCDCPRTVAVCRNRLVWMNSDGRVYTLVVSGQYSERNVREIGQKIRELLLRHTTSSLRGATAADHDGRYVLLVGNTAYTFEYAASGFAYLTNYASSAKAAQTLAWFIRDYGGLPEGASCCLVSDGAARALLFVIEDAGDTFVCATTVYVFGGDGEDVYNTYAVDADGALVCTQETRPITSTFTTKAFDFGDSASFKRIKALFLTADCDEAAVRFLPDGEDVTAWKTFRSHGMQTHLVMPSVKRCRMLSIRVSAEGQLRVKGLRVHYTPFGTVR